MTACRLAAVAAVLALSGAAAACDSDSSRSNVVIGTTADPPASTAIAAATPGRTAADGARAIAACVIEAWIDDDPARCRQLLVDVAADVCGATPAEVMLAGETVWWWQQRSRNACLDDLALRIDAAFAPPTTDPPATTAWPVPELFNE